MNEPWVNVVSRTQTMHGIAYQRTVSTDRVGYRQVLDPVARISREYPFGQGATRKRLLFLLEDSEDDAAMFMRVVRGTPCEVSVVRATNMAQARHSLWDLDPDLITLDCHLPGESGLQLLRDIRCHYRLKYVPVVMLSGSYNEDDVTQAYLLGANSFIRKPVATGDYVESVRLLLDYWLEKNCLSALLREEHARPSIPNPVSN